MKKTKISIYAGLLVPLVTLPVAMTASTHHNTNGANEQVVQNYEQPIEFTDSSKIAIENMLNSISTKKFKTNSIDLMANRTSHALDDGNYEEIKVISQNIQFKDSDLQDKLIEYGQLENLKMKVSKDVINEYYLSLQMRHGWNFFSSHFWETRGMSAWATGTFLLSSLYNSVLNTGQVLGALACLANKDWLGFSENLAGLEFSWELPKWILDIIHSTAKGIDEWKIRTGCISQFWITPSIIV